MKSVKEQLVASLERVQVVLKSNDSNSGYTLDVDSVVKWFEKLDKWLEKYYEEIGQVNLVYFKNRNVEILGNEIFCYEEDLKRILRGVKNYHFAVEMKFDLNYFVKNFSTILNCKTERLVDNISIIICDTECSIDKENLDRLLCDMIPYYSGFKIIGSYDALMHYGLFSMKSVCSTHLDLSMVDGELERLYPNYEKPCMNKISSIVYSDGYVYPCEGLVGLKNAAIGKINASSDEMKIFEERRKPLLEWYKDGPSLENEDIIVESDELPYYCRRHRAQLIEQSKGNCF